MAWVGSVRFVLCFCRARGYGQRLAVHTEQGAPLPPPLLIALLLFVIKVTGACLLFCVFLVQRQNERHELARADESRPRFYRQEEIGHPPVAVACQVQTAPAASRRASSPPRPAGGTHPHTPRRRADHWQRTIRPAGADGGSQLVVQRPAGAPMRTHACPVDLSAAVQSFPSLRSDPLGYVFSDDHRCMMPRQVLVHLR